jgi:hypothetical protein
MLKRVEVFQCSSRSRLGFEQQLRSFLGRSPSQSRGVQHILVFVVSAALAIRIESDQHEGCRGVVVFVVGVVLLLLCDNCICERLLLLQALAIRVIGLADDNTTAAACSMNAACVTVMPTLGT